MALIVPFRGITYHSRMVPDLPRLVAPPYDVISPEEQEALHRRHELNVVRLILNQETPEDGPGHNRYSRAAGFYRDWLREGVLVRAEEPQFYFLEEEFSPPPFLAGKEAGRKVRRGFIGLIRLEEFAAGTVLPHEKTQTKPKADRLALMRACRANFSQVFSLYADPEGEMAAIFERVSSIRPDCDFTNDSGVRHILRKVGDREALRRARAVMRPKKIFIADGHHRYETALAYQKEKRARVPEGAGREPFNFTMMYFSALEDEGLTILATHRVITRLEGFRASSFLERLGVFFAVESFPFVAGDELSVRERFLRALSSRGGTEHAMGLFLSGESRYRLLTLQDSRAMERADPALPPSLRALDVSILHRLIFQDLLKIGPEEVAGQKNILYFKDPHKALEQVRSGRGMLAFLLNPTKVSQIREVALAGGTMPPKSTFFYPKLLSGLVLNPLDEDEEIDLE
ncbi:MAG: DUF1015 domain-containing protein [Deltaproteobacteria bacterium]|nr:DUF1015 domain-containing protein [Deltaproteobacteria bacterium]